MARVKRGEALIKQLTDGGIRIEAVADGRVGKKIGEYTTISLDELCKRAHQEICIITLLISTLKSNITFLMY